MEEKTSDASTPHQIPRNTVVAEVMKEVTSFIEIKLKCSVFTYHILKL